MGWKNKKELATVNAAGSDVATTRASVITHDIEEHRAKLENDQARLEEFINTQKKALELETLLANTWEKDVRELDAYITQNSTPTQPQSVGFRQRLFGGFGQSTKPVSEESLRALQQLLIQGQEHVQIHKDTAKQLAETISEAETYIVDVDTLLARYRHEMFREELHLRSRERKGMVIPQAPTAEITSVKQMNREIKELGYSVDALIELQS